MSSPPSTASGGYRRLLRWAAVPITNRRWAAPLSAVALGFGLFVGVAIGPGASGTLATNAAQIVEIPSFSRGTEEAGGGGGRPGGSSSTVDPAVAEPAVPPVPEPAFAEPSPVGSFAVGSPPPAEPPDTEAGGAPELEEKEDETEPQELSGVVVHVNPAAGSYTVAEASGTLNAVHAGKAPAPGAEIEVPVRPLVNGTFAEAGRRLRTASATRATLSGIVTYVDPTPEAPVYALSKRGVSVLVHVHPEPGGAPVELPVPGTLAEVKVEIESPPLSDAIDPESPPPAIEPVPAETVPGCAPDPALPTPPAFAPAAVLWQRRLSADGVPFAYGDFEGAIAAVCPESEQLAISADDIRESSHDLVFTVPAEIDTGGLDVGQSVAATATIGPAGALTLTGLASDERTKGADDYRATQGDLAVEEPRK